MDENYKELARYPEIKSWTRKEAYLHVVMREAQPHRYWNTSADEYGDDLDFLDFVRARCPTPLSLNLKEAADFSEFEKGASSPDSEFETPPSKAADVIPPATAYVPLASTRHLHIQCVGCGVHIIVSSIDEEGSRYTECVNCGRKKFVVHEASRCLEAKKFCPIFKEEKGLPRLTVADMIKLYEFGDPGNMPFMSRGLEI